MDKMSDDVLEIIISFLSLKEKINVRMVSKGFKLSISEENETYIDWKIR